MFGSVWCLCGAFVAMHGLVFPLFCFRDFSWLSVATSWPLVPFIRSILFSALSSRVSNGAMTFVCHLTINIFFTRETAEYTFATP